jgi:hypothetical protein
LSLFIRLLKSYSDFCLQQSTPKTDNSISFHKRKRRLLNQFDKSDAVLDWREACTQRESWSTTEDQKGTDQSEENNERRSKELKIGGGQDDHKNRADGRCTREQTNFRHGLGTFLTLRPTGEPERIWVGCSCEQESEEPRPGCALRTDLQREAQQKGKTQASAAKPINGKTSAWNTWSRPR